jgi:hypothetical protein
MARSNVRSGLHPKCISSEVLNERITRCAPYELKSMRRMEAQNPQDPPSIMPLKTGATLTLHRKRISNCLPKDDHPDNDTLHIEAG